MSGAHPPPGVTEAEFAVLVRRAGLPLDEGARRVLHGVYGHLEGMMERNRVPVAGGDRTRSEPAHVFVPGQGWPAS